VYRKRHNHRITTEFCGITARDIVQNFKSQCIKIAYTSRRPTVKNNRKIIENKFTYTTTNNHLLIENLKT